MRKPGTALYGVLCILLGTVSLTGCDLLGQLLPKSNAPKQPAMTSEPITIAPQTQPEVPAGPIPSDVLVRIGNWSLSQDEFKNRLDLLKQQLPGFKENDPNAKSAVLDELIRQQLLVKEAEDSNIGDSKEIKDAVEDFRKTLLVQEIASKLTKDTVATEEEARAYYDANKDKLTSPVTWSVSEIVVPDEATAKSILVQALQGSDFAQLAQAQSKADNAADGGKLKSFMTGEAPFAAMQTAIDNLDVGGVSEVFRGPDGYYIVKVDGKKGGVLKSYSEIKDRLMYFLTQQKQQAVILRHLKELADKYKPEYNKDLIESVIGK